MSNAAIISHNKYVDTYECDVEDGEKIANFTFNNYKMHNHIKIHEKCLFECTTYIQMLTVHDKNCIKIIPENIGRNRDNMLK